MDFLTPREADLARNQWTPPQLITQGLEEKIIEDSIANQWNVELKSEQGALSFGGTPEWNIWQGEGQGATEKNFYDRTIYDKFKDWYGGIGGTAPYQIQRAQQGLTATKAEWAWVPWNPIPMGKIEAERNRIDEAFLANRDTQIEEAIKQRYGANAENIPKLLESSYGPQWKQSFAPGVKNSNAFLERVQSFLYDQANLTTENGRIKNELNSVFQTNTSKIANWAEVNLIKDYDTILGMGLTMGAGAIFGGGLKVVGATAQTLGRLSLYGGLRAVGKTALANSFMNWDQVAGRAVGRLALEEAAGTVGEAVAGPLQRPGLRTMLNQVFQDSIGNEYNLGRQAIARGSIIAETTPESLVFNNEIPKNPFGWTNLKAKAQYNNLRIVGQDGITIAEDGFKNNVSRVLTNVGLSLDDVLLVGRAETALGHYAKNARVGAIIGFADGFANSVWAQKEDQYKTLVMENRDLPGFDLGQAMHDGLMFGAMGGSIGFGMGVVFAPFMTGRAVRNLWDGTYSLGTPNAKRGFLQMFGSGRVSKENFELDNSLAKFVGVEGYRAAELANASTQENLRAVLKHLTGDDKTADFFLHPDWQAAHDVHPKEIMDLVGVIVKILNKSDAQYSVNPLSKEMFADIITDLATKKAQAKAVGKPLSAMDLNVITATEAAEKYGPEVTKSVEPVANRSRSISYEEYQKQSSELNDQLTDGKINQEQYKAKLLLLETARKNNINVETKVDQINKLNAKIEEAQNLHNQNAVGYDASGKLWGGIDKMPAKESGEWQTKLQSSSDNLKKLKNSLQGLTDELNVLTDAPHSTASVVRADDGVGQINRIVINGYDLSNTKAGFILTKYLNALDKRSDAVTVGLKNSIEQRSAMTAAAKEIETIELEMDKLFTLNKEGKTRGQLREEWMNQKWADIQANPVLKQQFDLHMNQAIDFNRASLGDRFVAMNWFAELRLGSSPGKLWNKLATYGSGVTDSMYTTVDIMHETFRMVDDATNFGYSDLAAKYNTLSISQAVDVAIRKAVVVNESVARIRKQFPEMAKEIQRRVIRTIREGGETIDVTGLSKEAVKEANNLVTQTRDFYQWAADRNADLGQKFKDSVTYIPQMLTRPLTPVELEKLKGLGLVAVRDKLLQPGASLSKHELHRLGLVELDASGQIVNIPEDSIFYITSTDGGKPIPMEEMIKQVNGMTIDDLRVFEAKRRLESDSQAKLPDDLQDFLNDPIRMATATTTEQAAVLDKIKKAAVRMIDRANQTPNYSVNDLYHASRHLSELRRKAELFKNTDMVKFVDDTLVTLKEKYGLDVNHQPESPIVTMVNSLESVKGEQAVRKVLAYASPSVSITRDGVTTVIHNGHVFSRYVPLSKANQIDAVFPALMFTMQGPLVNGNRAAQEIGHNYTMSAVSKKIANQFGEQIPVQWINTVDLPTISDSMVTMEHMMDWVGTTQFKTEVEKIMQFLPQGTSKTDAGMILLGGWVRAAKEHNMSALDRLKLSSSDRHIIALEFNELNLGTLRARSAGVDLPTQNSALMNERFNRVLRNSNLISDEAKAGITLWNPSDLYSSIETKTTKIPTIESRKAELIDLHAKTSTLTGAEKDKNLLDIAELEKEIANKTASKQEAAQLIKALRESRKLDKVITEGTDLLDKRTKLNNLVSRKPKKTIDELTVEIDKIIGEINIRKELIKDPRTTDGIRKQTAEEIKTREQKINGTKTQKGLVQKRKEVKEYEANVKALAEHDVELSNFVKTLTPRGTVTKNPVKQLNELITTRSTQREAMIPRRIMDDETHYPTGYSKVYERNGMYHPIDKKDGTVPQRLLHWYMELAAKDPNGVGMFPLSEFLINSMNESVDTAVAMGELERLGLSVNDINKRTGRVTNAGIKKYQKKLANSPDVLAAHQRAMNARVQKPIAQKISIDAEFEAYAKERTIAFENLRAEHDLDVLHQDNAVFLSSSINDLNYNMGLTSNVAYKVRTANRIIESRKVFLIDQLEQIAELKKELWDKNITRYRVVNEGENKTPILTNDGLNESQVTARLNVYNTNTLRIQNELKSLETAQELILNTMIEKKNDIPTELSLKNLDTNIGYVSSAFKKQLEVDPILLAEQKIHLLQTANEPLDRPIRTKEGADIPDSATFSRQALEAFDSIEEKQNYIKDRQNALMEKITILIQDSEMMDHWNEVDRLTKAYQNLDKNLEILNKIGYTLNRNVHQSNIGDIGNELAKIKEIGFDVDKQLEATSVSNTLRTFETVSNFITNTYDMFKEFTTTSEAAADRIWGESVVTYANGRAKKLKPLVGKPVSLDTLKRGMLAFDDHVALVNDGLTVGLLFRLEEIPFSDTLKTRQTKKTPGSTWFSAEEPKQRMVAYDLSLDTLDPIEIKAGKDGFNAKARKLIEARKSRNLSNPDSAITIDTILAKRKAEAPFKSTVEVEQLTDQIVGQLNALRTWANGVKKHSEIFNTVDNWFVKTNRGAALKDQVLTKANRDLVKTFNTMPMMTAEPNKQFKAIFTQLKKSRAEFDKILKDQTAMLQKQEKEAQAAFRNAANQEPVPVLTPERIKAIEETKTARAEIQGILKFAYELLGIKRPEGYVQGTGYPVQNFIPDLIAELDRLNELGNKLDNNKFVSIQEIQGRDNQTISKKQFAKEAKERQMIPSDLEEELKRADLDDDSILHADNLNRFFEANPNKKFPFIISKNAKGKLLSVKIDPNESITEFLKFISPSKDIPLHVQDSAYSLLTEWVYRAAKADEAKYRGHGRISIDRDDVGTILTQQFIDLLDWNKVQVDPSIPKAAKFYIDAISEIESTPNWKYDTKLTERRTKLIRDKKLLLVETMKLNQPMRELNPITGKQDLVKGKFDRIWFKGVAGRNYPDTNMKIGTVINKAKNQYRTWMERSTMIGNESSFPLHGEELEESVREGIESAGFFEDFRDRRSSSDSRNPVDLLIDKETEGAISAYTHKYSVNANSATDSLLRLALQSTGSNEDIMLYKMFIRFVADKISIDSDAIAKGDRENVRWLVMGETDRTKQRYKAGTLYPTKLKLLLKEIASDIKQELIDSGKGTGTGSRKIMLSISQPKMEEFYTRFKKDLLILSRGTVDSLDKVRTSNNLHNVIDGDKSSIYSLIKAITETEDILGKSDIKEPTSPLNFRTQKYYESGVDGPRRLISYTDIKQQAISGALLDSPDFKAELKAKYNTLRGVNDTATPTGGLEVVPAGQSTVAINELNISQLKYEIVNREFVAQLEKVKKTLKKEPMLLYKWALSEMTELKAKISDSNPTANPNVIEGLNVSNQAQFNTNDHAYNMMEYKELLKLTDDITHDHGISLTEQDLYNNALVDTGYLTKGNKNKNRKVATDIITESIGNLETQTPLSEIMRRYTNGDLVDTVSVLAGLHQNQSIKQILKRIPARSLENIINELDALKLVTIVGDRKELMSKIIHGTKLQELFTVTDNGLEVLQQDGLGYTLGYFNGADVKLSAKLKSLNNQLKLATSDVVKEDLERQISELNHSRFGLQSHELALQVGRYKLVNKQLDILKKLNTSELGFTSALKDNANPKLGYEMLDTFTKTEAGLMEELAELNSLIKTSHGLTPAIIGSRKLPEDFKKPQTGDEAISGTKWDGVKDPLSTVQKYTDAVNGSTRHYKPEWQNGQKTATEDLTEQWAYGLNGQPRTVSTSHLPVAVEEKRAIPYGVVSKPFFDSTDLLNPKNAELAGMLSEDIGEITLSYAEHSLSRTMADLAVRNRLKSRYPGVKLPEGFGWGEWVDYMRDVIKKYEQNPPRRSDGTVDTTMFKTLRENLENLNHYVLQKTHKEIPQQSFTSGGTKVVKTAKNIMIALLGPSMGLSVALTELPMSLARKNGSLEAFIKGLETLFGHGERLPDIRNSILAYESKMHGHQNKFGGDSVPNSELTWVKRMRKFFVQAFNPDPQQLASSGVGKVWGSIDNFLSNKAAAGMELGGLPALVNKILNIAYEKEKINLYQVRTKLKNWAVTLDNPEFLRLAKEASLGNKQSQGMVQRYFKQTARENGVPIEIATYLYMAKLDNVHDISSLARMLERSGDGSTFSLETISKNILDDARVDSLTSKMTKDLQDTTASKLGYYLELSARNASPEPFGIGSATFKYNRSSFGQMITFLASYPIAAFNAYVIRNGTTHTAASMLAVSLGILGLEVFAKRMRDIILGKDEPSKIWDGHKNSPLAFYLQDLSYAQTGGLMDQYLNPLYMILANSTLNPNVVSDDDKKKWKYNAPSMSGATFSSLESVIRQTLGAIDGISKGETDKLVNSLTTLGTEGAVGKGPVDIAKMLATLIADKTKIGAWNKVLRDYGPVDSEAESAFFKEVTKKLLNTMEYNQVKPFEFQPRPEQTQPIRMAPEVPANMDRPVSSTYIPTPTISSASKSKGSVFTPTIINALSSQKGVSPLLVDALIKESNP